MKSHTTTSTLCTAPQLAKLAGVTTQCISRRLDTLPPHTTLHDGSKSRPPKAWTLEQIAELILQRTAGWTDLELRLRAALLVPRPVEPLLDAVVTDEAGQILYVPPGMSLTAQQVAQDKQARAAVRTKSHARPRRAETAN